MLPERQGITAIPQPKRNPPAALFVIGKSRRTIASMTGAATNALSATWFLDVADARKQIEAWRRLGCSCEPRR